jgi:hypothetical protein
MLILSMPARAAEVSRWMDESLSSAAIGSHPPQLLEADRVIPNLRHVLNAIAVELHDIDIVGCYRFSCRLARHPPDLSELHETLRTQLHSSALRLDQVEADVFHHNDEHSTGTN